MDEDQAGEAAGLRKLLRQGTKSLHDRLDALLADAAVGDDAAYAAFLTAQHAARDPIERWAAAQMEPALCPPPSAPLIAADLAELGAPVPPPASFAFPAGGDPLGLAWALGGSSLGNRALLARRRRAGRAGATRFLDDAALPAFFRRILPLLAEPVSQSRADAARAAAEAVFACFLAAAARHPAPLENAA